jgi:hypothetical protein
MLDPPPGPLLVPTVIGGNSSLLGASLAAERRDEPQNAPVDAG